jgi:hypothetical protein
MYQLGFDLQAVPSTFCLNKSATGAASVAQTIFCSSSGRSPAKDETPSLFSQTRPSATSITEIATKHRKTSDIWGVEGSRTKSVLKVNRQIKGRTQRLQQLVTTDESTSLESKSPGYYSEM